MSWFEITPEMLLAALKNAYVDVYACGFEGSGALADLDGRFDLEAAAGRLTEMLADIEPMEDNTWTADIG